MDNWWDISITRVLSGIIYAFSARGATDIIEMFLRLTVLPPSLLLITSLLDMCSLWRGERVLRGWGSLSAGLGEIKDRFTCPSWAPDPPSLTFSRSLRASFKNNFAEPLKNSLIFYITKHNCWKLWFSNRIMKKHVKNYAEFYITLFLSLRMYMYIYGYKAELNIVTMWYIN